MKTSKPLRRESLAVETVADGVADCWRRREVAVDAAVDVSMFAVELAFEEIVVAVAGGGAAAARWERCIQ